jgi:hypothetical protein
VRTKSKLALSKLGLHLAKVKGKLALSNLGLYLARIKNKLSLLKLSFASDKNHGQVQL